ncbi:MAG: hypothetical protein QM811_29475 [Pirellulales bacterium]
MFGQGRPHARAAGFAPAASRRFGQPVERSGTRRRLAERSPNRPASGCAQLAFVLVMAWGYVAARGDDAPPQTAPLFAPPTAPAESELAGDARDWSIQFRIAWGGGTERLWRGEFAWSAGPGKPIRALGIEADEPGCVTVENGVIVVTARSPRGYDGVDARFPYDPAAKLKIRMRADDGTTIEDEVTLEALLKPSWQKNLDDRGNRLFIRRLPADQLRVDVKRDALLFAPRETWDLTVTPHLLPVAADDSLKIRAKLTAKAGGKEHWAQEFVIERWTPDWSKPQPGATA